MKILLTTLLVSCLLFIQGCAAGHPAFKDEGYAKWNDSVIANIKKDPSYEKIPMDTNEKVNSYIDISYKAYKKEINKQQFIDKLLVTYPKNKKSIDWIANQLPK